jgi:hypothetical protein
MLRWWRADDERSAVLSQMWRSHGVQTISQEEQAPSEDKKAFSRWRQHRVSSVGWIYRRTELNLEAYVLLRTVALKASRWRRNTDRRALQKQKSLLRPLKHMISTMLSRTVGLTNMGWDLTSSV